MKSISKILAIFFIVMSFMQSSAQIFEQPYPMVFPLKNNPNFIGQTYLYPLTKIAELKKMPQFGLGTFLQGSDEICKNSVLTALKAGYRHIDTAHAYEDERGVGAAVRESGIPREGIWITSKIWPNEYGEGKTLEAIDKMLARLQTDYIDMLYIHQPVGDYVGAWRDMEMQW